MSETTVSPDLADDLVRARAGDDDAFGRLVSPLRRELHAHCYRMLGSAHDADDALQDALVRAWRKLGSFEGRSSLRTWLYTVATRTCLDLVDARGRRALPVDLGPASDRVATGDVPVTEVAWLGPYPDEPGARAEERESVELAFVAALQHLPGNQRAALVLFEVLGFSAAEIATTMDTSTASVNSALQRARKLVAEKVPAASQQRTLREIDDARLREVVHGYSTALERGDAEALVALLTEDVTWSMPPMAHWYAGIGPVTAFAVPCRSAATAARGATSRSPPTASSPSPRTAARPTNPRAPRTRPGRSTCSPCAATASPRSRRSSAPSTTRASDCPTPAMSDLPMSDAAVTDRATPPRPRRGTAEPARSGRSTPTASTPPWPRTTRRSSGRRRSRRARRCSTSGAARAGRRSTRHGRRRPGTSPASTSRRACCDRPAACRTPGLTPSPSSRPTPRCTSFPAGGTDVVVSRHGAHVLRGPRRRRSPTSPAPAPGGRMVLLTWQGLEHQEWLRSFLTILAAGREVAFPPAQGPSPLSLSVPARVDAVLRDAGFTDVEFMAHRAPMVFGADPDDALGYVAGQQAGLLADLDPRDPRGRPRRPARGPRRPPRPRRRPLRRGDLDRAGPASLSETPSRSVRDGSRSALAAPPDGPLPPPEGSVTLDT